MNSRIIPLNLPARLAEEVDGNPVISRLESAVANSFPGLEVDIRNLDRRFFPGLVFSFIGAVDNDPTAPTGARLVDVDLTDPDLPKSSVDPRRRLPRLITQLVALSEALKAGKVIFLHSLTVGRVRLDFHYATGVLFDWDVTWRIIRSLKSEKMKVSLRTWPKMESPCPITLTGTRRTYQTDDGALSTAYKPGELTQSLCSPWQHDFRDCSCNFWASNRPDIVLAARPATIEEAQQPGSAADRAEDPILWIRWDRSQETAPQSTEERCRPLEMDHYEINERWKDLAVVLENRERSDVYAPPIGKTPDPLEPSVKDELMRLAGIEQALALEYLYARCSVRFNDKNLSPEEQEHADFIARELLVIAIGEMKHLGWVNQLLRELHERGYCLGKFEPALGVAEKIPPTGRRAKSRTLKSAIRDFIAAEAPSGTIDGQYAKLLDFFLAHSYPADLVELVKKIIDDGVTHYSRFREMQSLLNRKPRRLGRALRILPLDDSHYEKAKSLYQLVIENLEKAYSTSGKLAAATSKDMETLNRLMAELAEEGIGLPLIEIARELGQAKAARVNSALSDA